MRKIIKLIITIIVYILVVLYFLVLLIVNNPRSNKVCKNFDVVLSNAIESYFASSLPQKNGDTLKVTTEELISKGLLTLTDLQDVGTKCSGEAFVTKMNDQYYYYNDVKCGSCSIDNIYTSWSNWKDSLPNFNGKRYQVMINTLYNYSISEEKWTDWSDWGESIEKIKELVLPSGAEVVNTDVEEKSQYRYKTATYQWYKLLKDTEYYKSSNYYSETAPSGYKRLENSKRLVRMTKTYLSEADLKNNENLKDGDGIKVVTGYRIRTPKYIYSYAMSQSSNTYVVAGVSTKQSEAQAICKSQQPQWASTCVAYCTTSNGTTCTKYGYKYTVTNSSGTMYYLKKDGTSTSKKSEADYLSDSEYNNLKKKNSSLANYSKSGTPIYIYQTLEYTEGNCPSGESCSTIAMYKGLIYEYIWYKVVNSTKTSCNNGMYSEKSPEEGCVRDESTAKWSSWSEYSDVEVKKTDTNEIEIKKLVRYRKSYINSKDLVLKDWYSYDDFEEKVGKKIADLKNDKKVKLHEKIMYKYRTLK